VSGTTEQLAALATYLRQAWELGDACEAVADNNMSCHRAHLMMTRGPRRLTTVIVALNIEDSTDWQRQTVTHSVDRTPAISTSLSPTYHAMYSNGHTI